MSRKTMQVKNVEWTGILASGAVAQLFTITDTAAALSVTTPGSHVTHYLLSVNDAGVLCGIGFNPDQSTGLGVLLNYGSVIEVTPTVFASMKFINETNGVAGKITVIPLSR